jgi:glycosyltransferase involved in cell wall biosynthesis
LLSRTAEPGSQPEIVEPCVGPAFEFGTESYRATVYARAVLGAVPVGVPIIISDDPSSWRAGAWLGKRNPMILVVHGDNERYYRQIERYGPAASAIVSISHRIDGRVREIALGTAPYLTCIPIGIALGSQGPIKANESSAPIRLIWIGRMDEGHKRMSDLLLIATRLCSLCVDFKMTLVGDGPSRVLLERSLAAANLGDRVSIHGWASPSTVRTMLERSDVLLLPSKYEGLPVVMLEALAAGCAVVASRVSGVEDYESHPLATGCLWLHTVGDVDEATKLVLTAVATPPSERARKARSLAAAEFSIERCAQKYAELLSSLSPARPEANPLWRLKERAIELGSLPVAAERRLRLWAASR